MAREPTIAILSNAMRWGISNQHDHLARLRPPVHVQRLGQRCGDSLGPISTAARVQRPQVLLDLEDVRGETKVLRDIGMVLWGMIAVRDQANAQVLLRLQLSRFENMLGYNLDVLRRRRNVAALASCAILYKDEVSVQVNIRSVGSRASFSTVQRTASSCHRDHLQPEGSMAAAGLQVFLRRTPCLHPCWRRRSCNSMEKLISRATVVVVLVQERSCYVKFVASAHTDDWLDRWWEFGLKLRAGYCSMN